MAIVNAESTMIGNAVSMMVGEAESTMIGDAVSMMVGEGAGESVDPDPIVPTVGTN
jgi:hypothetical protein